jgi:glyoxylase-like metal-dependent hydrolase (beta-lactamase superfamily II)
MSNVEHRVGACTVVKVNELDLNDYTADKLLPDLTPDALARMPGREDPRIYDPETGTVPLSVHTWVVRGYGQTILIDTGVGNDKLRPTMLMFDRLHTPYLERLVAAGVQPGDVDTILLTHVHADHVGWNTRLENGHWVPTFPDATVFCSSREWRYGAALAAGDDTRAAVERAAAGFGDPARTPVVGVFEDSMAPVEAAGRVRLIEVDDEEVLDGFRFLPTPGHSIDHASIALTSQGEAAVFGGDVVHHPFEIVDPELVSIFCEFPDAARRSRVRLLEHLAETRALYFSSHFTGSSMGRVERKGANYRWAFLD